MSKTYTVGEIVRLGLLKNHAGIPYRHKASVLKILQRHNVPRVATVWGPGYAVSESLIKFLNKRWQSI